MTGTLMGANPVPGPLRILVVDDEAEIRTLVKAGLARHGFQVAEAEDGETALSLVWAGKVDLLVLDVNLPRMSGLAVLARIRRDATLPVILLTGRQEEGDRVLGLELGADDYVTKPFSPLELGARVTSVLRRCRPANARTQMPPEASLPATTVVVRVAERKVLVAGTVVDLTRKEFDLLACIASAPGRVFTRAELLAHVWESALEWQDPSTVTEHVRRLRRKIEVDPENPCWIQTVRGVGYRFVADSGDACNVALGENGGRAGQTHCSCGSGAVAG